MATLHRQGSLRFTAVKGAPEAVVPCCSRSGPLASRALAEFERAAWLRRAERLAANGLRVLAIACRSDGDLDLTAGGDLAFLGLVALRDPPRQDIKGAIAELRRAGIRVVMATGDHPSTALNIARAVGLMENEEQTGAGEAVVTGAALSSELGDPGAVTGRHVFARVTPEQKLELIGLFQHESEVVAMIGDGINDAPALKKADIGVAIGLRGTQVAREAADIVLLDDAFSTIVHAVREGRIIFCNIRRFSTYLLSCNLAEVLVVGLAVFLGLPLPLLPLQILFLNLVTDVFPAFALAMGKGDPDVLSRPPRSSGERILGRPQWGAIAIHGATIAAATLAALIIARGLLRLLPEEATTAAFLTIAMAQLWHVFSIRSSRTTMIHNEVVANRYVWYALLFCLALILAAVYVPTLAAALQLVPPGTHGWLLVLFCSLIPPLAGQLQLALTHARAKNADSELGSRAATLEPER
jgi:Ca2+-transporting ATPase